MSKSVCTLIFPLARYIYMHLYSYLHTFFLSVSDAGWR